MTARVLMWLPWPKKMPKGWQTYRRDLRSSRHPDYGRIIERTTRGNMRKRRP